MMRFSLIVLVFGLLGLGRYAQGAEYLKFLPGDLHDPLPPWRYVEMTKAVVHECPEWKPQDVQDLELIAWRSVTDDRPWYVNVALFAVRLRAGAWGLVALGQNPIPSPYDSESSRERHSQWHVYAPIADNLWNPVRVFPRRPSTRDVETFLEGWRWTSYDRGDWTIITSGF